MSSDLKKKIKKKNSQKPLFSLLFALCSLLIAHYSLLIALPYPDSLLTMAGIETKVPMELPRLDRKKTNKALVILFL